MADRERLNALRVVLVTDGEGDAARLLRIVTAACAGGVRAVQLREPGLSARELATLCAQLRPVIAACGGVLLVNDRVDVAAACADGAQVGHRSLPPPLARRALGPDRVLGVSVHEAGELAGLAAAGADFALLAPVWRTASKPGQRGLGVAAAGAITAASPVPVVWLGGVDVDKAAALAPLPRAQRPLGVALRSGLCSARDVEAHSRAVVAAFAAVLD